MVMCSAYGCNHYNVRERCRFYKLPKNKRLRKKWLTALRRTDVPTNVFVCSCHFKDGKKENLPEIFSFNKDKKFGTHYLSPEKKKIRRKLIQDTNNIPSAKRKLFKTADDDSVKLQEKTTALTVDVNQINQMDTSVAVQPTRPPCFLSPTVLEAQNYLLRLDLEKTNLKMSYLSERFSYEKICDNDSLFRLYTGLPQKKVFDSLFELYENIDLNYIYASRVEIISKKDQLLMTLMKLRQNFPHEDLAFRFNVSRGTVSNIIITWIHALHEILFMQLMSSVPTRNKNKLCLPNAFSSFTNCRIILDCTEVFMMTSRKSMSTQKLTYSSYKHRNTLKGLIGVAPNGVITFISDLYPGSTSDKEIVSGSNITEVLQVGDLVLADKGFLIRELLPPGVSLNIPPFLVTTQFTKAQIQQTESIAKARIHVERAIRRMKYYKILNLIPFTLSKYADLIFKVVGALTNLHYPLLKEIEELIKPD